MKCVNCKNYTLTYCDVMSLAPFGYGLSPMSFSCPKCKFDMKASGKSGLLLIAVLLILSFGSAFFLHYYGEKPSNVEAIIITVMVFGISYLVIWPKILKLEPYSIAKPWLPKNRALGYLVYFIFPISVMVGLLALATYFEWGL